MMRNELDFLPSYLSFAWFDLSRGSIFGNNAQPHGQMYPGFAVRGKLYH